MAANSAPSTRSADSLLELIDELQTRYIATGASRVWWGLALERIVAHTTSAFGFIGRIDEQHGRPVLRTLSITDIAWNDWSREHFDANAADGLLFDKPASLFGRTVVYGDTVLTNDPAHDPRSGGLPQGHPPLLAYVGIPVADRGGVVGMIGLANRPGGYDMDFVETLRPLTAVIGELVGRERLALETAESKLRIAELEVYQEQLQLISEATDAAVMSNTIAEVQMILSRALQRVYPDAHVCVYEPAGNGDLCIADRLGCVDCPEAISAQNCTALRLHAPHLSAPGRIVPPCPHVPEGRIGICLPLDTGGLSHGALVLQFAADVVRDPERLLARAAALTQRFAVAMTVVALRASLHERAHTDELTGLMNRAAFVDAVSRMLAAMQRHPRHCSLLLLDLDRFKEINDTHGHVAGDEMLRRVAALITREVREGDLCARFGGDEFAILLPDTDADEARRTAERIRTEIDRISVEGSGVAASVGAIGCTGHGSPWPDWDAIYRAADAALYQAKAAGGRCVVISEP